MMTQQLPVQRHFVMFGGCLNQHPRQRLANVFTFRQGHFGEAVRVQASKMIVSWLHHQASSQMSVGKGELSTVVIYLCNSLISKSGLHEESSFITMWLCSRAFNRFLQLYTHMQHSWFYHTYFCTYCQIMLQANTGKHFDGRLWKVSLVSNQATISSESKIVILIKKVSQRVNYTVESTWETRTNWFVGSSNGFYSHQTVKN